MTNDPVMGFLDEVGSHLDGKSLYVGFVDGSTYHDGTPVADVAHDNEFGDPREHRPPRPFFRNAISEHEDQWIETMGRGLASGQPVDKVLEVMGAIIAGDVKLSITQLYDPALSPVTVALRMNKEYRQSIGLPVNNSTKPLVDTGTMLESVNYEVRGADESQIDS